MADTVIMITVLAVLLISVTFYVLPSIIAMARKVPNTGSVVVINILLGWTFVGWVVALAMALRSRPQPMVPVVPARGLGGPPPPVAPSPPQHPKHQQTGGPATPGLPSAPAPPF